VAEVSGQWVEEHFSAPWSGKENPLASIYELAISPTGSNNHAIDFIAAINTNELRK
jgi:hypothetical protein